MCIRDRVRPGRPAVDVGADHGYLISYLAAKGIVPRGIACDINPQPLEKSRETVRRCGLEGKVRCVLTDGLSGIGPQDAQEVIIAGMGGDLIADIIRRADWLKSPQFHLVLQPMTKPEHLRRFLAREGYAILLEQAVRSGRFVYLSLIHISLQSLPRRRQTSRVPVWLHFYGRRGRLCSAGAH